MKIRKFYKKLKLSFSSYSFSEEEKGCIIPPPGVQVFESKFCEVICKSYERKKDCTPDTKVEPVILNLFEVSCHRCCIDTLSKSKFNGSQCKYKG